jgi:hypothetical protein
MLFLLFPISLIYLIALPSSFCISPRSFPSLNLISLHPFHICSIVSLSSLHILHLLSSSSIKYLVSLSSFPHLHLAIIVLSLVLSLPRYFSVIYLSDSLLYLYSLILSLVPCLSVPSSLLLSCTFIHLPFGLNLSASSLAYPLLF